MSEISTDNSCRYMTENCMSKLKLSDKNKKLTRCRKSKGKVEHLKDCVLSLQRSLRHLKSSHILHASAQNGQKHSVR